MTQSDGDEPEKPDPFYGEEAHYIRAFPVYDQQLDPYGHRIDCIPTVEGVESAQAIVYTERSGEYERRR